MPIARRNFLVAGFATGAMAAWGGCPARAETASPWIEGFNSRTRLIAGKDNGKLYGGLVIEMSAGWKTYWRHPGDSGGVPPTFEWSKSNNLRSAQVLYPAPKRLSDPAGDAIGYAGRVVFPVRIVAADLGRPVKIDLQLEYGICKDICVPVEVSLELDLPVDMQNAVPSELASSLDRVPRPHAARRPTDPRLLRNEARLAGEKPHLAFDVEFAGGWEGADAFIEAPDGIYVPQPKLVGKQELAGDGKLARCSFVVDLDSGIDPAELRGKTLMLTLVSAAGQTELPWRMD